MIWAAPQFPKFIFQQISHPFLYLYTLLFSKDIYLYINQNKPTPNNLLGRYLYVDSWGDHFTPASHFVKNKEKMSIKYIFIYVCFPLALGLFINDFSTFLGFFYPLSSGNLRSPLLLYRLIQQRSMSPFGRSPYPIGEWRYL